MISVQYGGRIFVVYKRSDGRTVSDVFNFLSVRYTEMLLRLACLSHCKEE
jgi:hypothetical protein